VAQDAAGAAGEDSGHPLALDRQVPVPDRVYAPMDTVQAARLGPLVHAGHRQPELDQLLQ
jgi:hypothetical protein